MPYPFLTNDERPKERTQISAQGLRVTYANNTIHWFPAASKHIALFLAESVVPEDLWTHVGTTVEWGEKMGPLFVLKEHVRGPKLSPDAVRRPEHDPENRVPSIIEPGS